MLLHAIAEFGLLPLQNGAFDGPFAGELFLLARLVFGGVLAFMGFNHFLNVDSMSGYAAAKGLPAPTLAVTGSGGTLMFGGLGIAAGVFPTLAAGALAVFFLVVTPTMHDFWAVDPDDRQDEMTNFLKNLGLLAGSLGLLAVSAVSWPYAVGVGLF